MFLIDFFQCPLLFEFISSKLKTPQTIEESIDYLSKPNCEFFETHFQSSISILIQQFDHITQEQFKFISNSHFELILKSEELKIENEDFLFQLIISLIKEDSNRRSLLKFVQFSFVSSQLIQEYFCNFSIDEIDFELFEALKCGLFHVVFGKESGHSLNRWRNQTKLITKQENEEISNENSELRNALKQSQNENSELKNTLKQKETENLELKNALKQKETENMELKNKFQQNEAEIEKLQHLIYHTKCINITDHQGIISSLKKENPNLFSLTCSYNDCSKVENILEYNNSYWCGCSDSISEHWFCFEFKENQILPLTYLIRDHNCRFLKGWKVEGSNDGNHWELIDEKRDQTCFTQKYQENTFSIQSQSFFSFIKVTQIQPNGENSKCFNLTFFELSGFLLQK
jgi:hypothetical protein